MTNPQKRKGDTFERAIADYLTSQGVQCQRAYGAGRPQDIGDLIAPGWAIECKNHRRLELAAWMDELAAEQTNSGAQRSALIVKRRMRPAGDAYVIQTLASWAGQL